MKEWKSKINQKTKQNISYNLDRYLRYAIDIDEGVDYVGHFQQKCNRNPLYSCYFLDLGFAPGGMATLLLESAPNAYGIGVTIPSENGGYAVPDSLLNHRKFTCIGRDVEELATMTKTQMMKALNVTAQTFEGFDLVICAITPFNDPSKESLDKTLFGINKWRLLYAQLVLAFSFLREGGLLLNRHKLSYRICDTQLIYTLLSRFAGFVPTKPKSQFAIRRTFWTLWQGWKGNDEKLWVENKELIGNMKALLEKPVEETTQQDISDCIINCKIPELWVRVTCPAVRPLLRPMLEEQVRALQQFIDGKSDQMCTRSMCLRTKSTNCFRAHSEEELISGVKKAHERIDKRMEKWKHLVLHHETTPHALNAAPKRPPPSRSDSSTNWRRPIQHPKP